MSVRIALLRLKDADELVAHVARQIADDADLENPVSPAGSAPFDAEIFRIRRRQLWSLPVGDVEWSRAWGAYVDGELVGHADLRASSVFTEAHRAMLGLAVEKRFRRRGVARALMHALIEWARAEPKVSWIDLGVFEHNEAAADLYRKLGFEEIGRLRDRFRVDGVSVTDVQMALAV